MNIKRRRNQVAINAIDKGNDDMKLFNNVRNHVKILYVAVVVLFILQFFF